MEISALRSLVAAADGHASPEPVIGLAIALLGPWAGDRRDIIDKPSQLAPSSPDQLINFIREVRPQLSAPLPADRGWLGWLRYARLAMPLADLQDVPAWVLSPVLEGGWLALPPRGGFQGPGVETLATDGRLALLHVLCSQIGADVPLDAVMAVAEWFIGPKAAEWSRVAAGQCSAMAFPTIRSRAWFSSVRVLKASQVVPIVCGPAVAADWTRPAPTPAELAAQREHELRRIATRENALAWHKQKTNA